MRKIDGCDREALEFWGYPQKAIVVLGNRHWPEHARIEADKVG